MTDFKWNTTGRFATAVRADGEEPVGPVLALGPEVGAQPEHPVRGPEERLGQGLCVRILRSKPGLFLHLLLNSLTV